MKTCGDCGKDSQPCRFFVISSNREVAQKGIGVCHKNPPVIVVMPVQAESKLINGGAAVAVQPLTMRPSLHCSEIACGAWEAAEQVH